MIINFIKVVAVKLRNDPKVTFTALSNSTLFKSSPINAPKNGGKMIPPLIGAINPMTNPTEVPTIPAFVPPKRLVLRTGRI